MNIKLFAIPAIVALTLSACGESSKHDISFGMGAQPTLPAPVETLIPTVHVAAVLGWNNSSKPTPAKGLNVKAFADGLAHPRWLYELPNGDILVAETNFEMQGLEGSIKGWFAK